MDGEPEAPDAELPAGEPAAPADESLFLPAGIAAKIARASWKVPGGVIKFSGMSMVATCTNPLHAEKGNPCRISRLVNSKNAESLRGRPLGFLLAWLAMDCADRALHINAVSRKKMTIADGVFLNNFERRSTLRQAFSESAADDPSILLGFLFCIFSITPT